MKTMKDVKKVVAGFGLATGDDEQKALEAAVFESVNEGKLEATVVTLDQLRTLKNYKESYDFSSMEGIVVFLEETGRGWIKEVMLDQVKSKMGEGRDIARPLVMSILATEFLEMKLKGKAGKYVDRLMKEAESYLKPVH